MLISAHTTFMTYLEGQDVIVCTGLQASCKRDTLGNGYVRLPYPNSIGYSKERSGTLPQVGVHIPKAFDCKVSLRDCNESVEYADPPEDRGHEVGRSCEFDLNVRPICST